MRARHISVYLNYSKRSQTFVRELLAVCKVITVCTAISITRVQLLIVSFNRSFVAFRKGFQRTRRLILPLLPSAAVTLNAFRGAALVVFSPSSNSHNTKLFYIIFALTRLLLPCRFQSSDIFVMLFGPMTYSAPFSVLNMTSDRVIMLSWSLF